MIFISIPFRKGMSLFSFLWVLALFSAIFLAVSQWGNSQRQRAIAIYQGYQAVQIAENQKQRQFLGLPIETKVKQNGIDFHIQDTGNKLIIRYPLGEIEL